MPINRILAIAAAITVAGAVAACGESEWNGTLYPDREDLQVGQSLGMFATLDACRAAAEAAVAQLRAAAGGEFAAGGPLPGWECSADCRTDADGDLVCRRVESGVPDRPLN